MKPRGIWPNVAPQVVRLARKISSCQEAPLAAITGDLISGAVSYRIWYAHSKTLLTLRQAATLHSVCALCGGAVAVKDYAKQYRRPDDSGWDHSLCHGSPLARPDDEKYDKAEHRAAVHHAISTGQRLP